MLKLFPLLNPTRSHRKSRVCLFKIRSPILLLLILATILSAVALARAQNTALVMNSPQGESVGNGYYYYFSPGDGSFHASQNYRNGVTVSFTGPSHNWSLFFAAPAKALLTPGTYDGAV